MKSHKITEEDSIFKTVAHLLLEEGASLGTVESCTGGGIANAFVLLPGASNFFKGGLITYSNELKSRLAHVAFETLEKYGAVSEEVVKEMALGGLLALHVDYTIAVSGIAGPSGGSEEKPVGLVWIAVASKAGVVTKKHFFGENRSQNIQQSILHAVVLLSEVLNQEK
ncbi:MAG TPA: CinA family protein [Brumimicrobium sp.]|nr:CinA family protein [Brumimicrobium sp.]